MTMYKGSAIILAAYDAGGGAGDEIDTIRALGLLGETYGTQANSTNYQLSDAHPTLADVVANHWPDGAIIYANTAITIAAANTMIKEVLGLKMSGFYRLDVFRVPKSEVVAAGNRFLQPNYKNWTTWESVLSNYVGGEGANFPNMIVANGATDYVHWICYWKRPDTGTFEDIAGGGGYFTDDFRIRWCDATDTIQITYNYNDATPDWFTVKTGVLTLQAALDWLATAYPSESYDAASRTVGSCEEITVRLNPTGTPGTIPFNSGFDQLIEDNGTWILPMKWGVDYRPWVL